MGKATDVDEAQVDGEEQATANEPDHDQGQLSVADRHRKKDEAPDRIGHRPHGLIDQFIHIRPYSALCCQPVSLN